MVFIRFPPSPSAASSLFGSFYLPSPFLEPFFLQSSSPFCSLYCVGRRDVVSFHLPPFHSVHHLSSAVLMRKCHPILSHPAPLQVMRAMREENQAAAARPRSGRSLPKPPSATQSPQQQRRPSDSMPAGPLPTSQAANAFQRAAARAQGGASLSRAQKRQKVR